MTADDLQATGAMAALLKDAIKPNLIQTLEHTPAHCTRWTICQYCPWMQQCTCYQDGFETRQILRLRKLDLVQILALRNSMDIKCRMAGLKPDASSIGCNSARIKV